MATAKDTAQLTYEQDHIHDTHVPSLIAASVASLVIAFVAVLLRLISRRISRTQLYWDDWTICLSLILISGYIVPNCVSIAYGFGRHEILVTKPETFSKVVFAGEIIYTWAIVSFKVSALCLLQRIFPGRGLKYTLWGIGAFVLAYSLVQTFGTIFTCTPVRAVWDPSIKGSCINIDDVYLVCSSLNIATDFIILCVPMPTLWKLKISMAQRIQLTIIFASGGIVCIISIVRISLLKEASLVDSSYSDTGPYIASALEVAFGVLSACLPTYRPILSYLFGRRSFLTTSPTKALPDHDSGTVHSNMQRRLETDAGMHPFSRLEEGPKELWAGGIPLSDINHKAIAEQGDPEEEVDYGLGANEIKVKTHLEQVST